MCPALTLAKLLERNARQRMRQPEQSCRRGAEYGLRFSMAWLEVLQRPEEDHISIRQQTGQWNVEAMQP